MESVDWWAEESVAGEEGAWCTKTSSGRYSTNAVTVLTTWRWQQAVRRSLRERREKDIYLDETVSRVPVVEVRHSKLLAIL